MRDLPADLHIEPAPHKFTAHIVATPDGRALKWNAQVSTPNGPMRVEYGLRLRDGEASTIAEAIRSITETAWQTTELARLGRTDLLHYVTVGRHANRPNKGRALSVEAQRLLDNVKGAHEARLRLEAAAAEPEA